MASIAAKGAWAVVGFHVPVKGYNNPPGRKADAVFFRTLAGYGKVGGKTVGEALEAAYHKVDSKAKQWQDCYGVAGAPGGISPLDVLIR